MMKMISFAAFVAFCLLLILTIPMPAQFPATIVYSITATHTAGTGVTSVTCNVGACQVARGTVTIVGGTATTGTIDAVSWPGTNTAPVCNATQNGGSTNYGIGNSIATTTGFNITAASSVSGATVVINYACVK